MSESQAVGPHTIDRTPEYEEFIQTLKAFHEKRGTNFDPEPKVGALHVDLFKLYHYIVDRGGYDKISDEKLAWRRMCEGLGLMTSNPPAAAFGLKSIFYKYLAAYEIKTVYGKEPPPPEILELTTARGSGLLSRTLETYKVNRRDTGHEPSDGDDGTPARDRNLEETPGSGRASRGLREAPPQRVIFQPDTASPRQVRHASGQQSTPTAHASHPPAHPHPQSHQHPHPHAHPHPHPHPHPPGQMQSPNVHQVQHHPQRGGPSQIWNPPNAASWVPNIRDYQTGEPVRTDTRVVPTPINTPEAFPNPRRIAAMQAAAAMQPRQPGSKFNSQHSQDHVSCHTDPLCLAGSEGPNIYLRCVSALRSGIQAEQAFALHHLVKISFERGEKFRFEQFGGLIEGLVEKALEVGNLFYDVEWTILFDVDQRDADIGQLGGFEGTPDIIHRIARLQPKDIQDAVLPADFSDKLVLITEAILTIRNMAMLPDNAVYLADYPTLKDLLVIILHLPKLEVTVELKHFALDIAEQVTPNLTMDSSDPLYQTLLAQLDSSDRGCILTSLRAISRVSMNKAETNKLSGVAPVVLRDIMNWLLLNDDEMLDACLDFLYQYTAVASNVDNLLKTTKAEHLVSHLVRLLSHGAKRETKEIIVRPEHKAAGGEYIVELPRDLFERLLLADEPERCYQWLRSLFEEDADSQITQIAVWQAYTNTFLEPLKRSGRPMINAAEFIRNISQVYHNAGAQIVKDRGPVGEVNRFIIRGIRPRLRPISPTGREYFRCLWERNNLRPNEPIKCGGWFVSAEAMYKHILVHHLGQELNANGGYVNSEAEFPCKWAECTKFARPVKMRLATFMSHVKTHLVTEERRCALHNDAVSQTPGGSANGGGGNSNNVSGSKRAKRPYVRPAETISISCEETITIRDERNPNAPPQAGGIPLSAILVLRNIARNAVKSEAVEELRKLQAAEDMGETGGWNERLFRNVSMRLYEIMAENKYLAPHISVLLQLLDF